MRVVLADDHQLVRQCLKLCLSTAETLVVVGEASTGEEALSMARELKPDVVVADITMPGMSGIEVARRVVTEGLPCKVVILSMHSAREFVTEALAAGASAYVVKTAAYNELVLALEAVKSGGMYMSPSVASLVGGMHKGGDRESRSRPLSPRERLVLRAIGQGTHTKGIAHELGVSDKAVHAMRARIMRKLEVDSVADLTRTAIRLGLISLD